jgi:gamma-glutamyl:cysteine ligase YbdK (ATP-grasp superfamily)
MRDHLHALIDAVAPAAARLACAAEVEAARDLVERPRARIAREVAADGGARALAAWQAERFLLA